MTSEPGRKSTVFIVDDESAVRDAFRMVVETMNLSVKCFASAVEFLEFVASGEDLDPVCLIVDIQMPEVSGMELLTQLSALGKQFPVILTTGHGGTALRQRAEELGAVAFLEKPFRAAELQKVIVGLLK